MSKQKDERKIGWVVLAIMPGKNAWRGYVENSFDMGWEEDSVYVYWSGPYYWGNKAIGVWDGEKNAKDAAKEIAKANPDWTVEVFDLNADNCPVEINLDRYLRATNKYEMRNAKFSMRELA